MFGFDVFNAGTMYSKFGGIVGIPINFTYDSIDSVSKSDILVSLITLFCLTYYVTILL